jgi:hypothetical protein
MSGNQRCTHECAGVISRPREERSRFQWPAEHGAWGILLTPYVCAAAVAGRWNLPLALCGVCAVALFLLRGSLLRTEAARKDGERAEPLWMRLAEPAHLALAGSAAGSGALLVVYYGRWELLAVGIAGAALYALQTWLVAEHREHASEKRSLLAELVGVLLLTLSAPAAWISARGTLFERTAGTGIFSAAGIQVWLLNLLFFLGGILYVKYRVRGLLAHREFEGIGERVKFAWPVFFYHLLLVMFLLYWVASGASHASEALTLQGWTVALAFAPGVLRAGRLAFELGRRFPIRRLGWTEMVHAVVFAGLLVLAYRLGM